MITRMTRKIELPHEPGQWVEIRPLSWRKLQDARDSRVRELAKQMQSLGRDVLDALPKGDRSEAPSAEQETPASLLNAYSLGALLRAGIVAWSYDEPVSGETIDELDEQTAQLIARELVLPVKRSMEQQLENFFASTSTWTAPESILPPSG